MPYDVFISYCAADEAAALTVVQALERSGVSCWIAVRDIAPGEIYPRAIIQAIEQSRGLLLIFSPHSNRSQQVLREVERAVHRRLPILSLRLQDVPLSPDLEYFLSICQWQNAFPGHLESHLAPLVRSVTSLLDHPQNPAPRQARTSRFAEDGGRKRRFSVRFPCLFVGTLLLLMGLAAAGWLRRWSPFSPGADQHEPALTPPAIAQTAQPPPLADTMLKLLHVAGTTETEIDAQFAGLKCGDELRLVPRLSTGRSLYVLEILGNGKAKLFPKSTLSTYNGGWSVDGPAPTLTLIALDLPRPLSMDQSQALEQSITALGSPAPLEAGTQLAWSPVGVQMLARGARGPKQVGTGWAQQILQLLRQLEGASFQGYTLPVAPGGRGGTTVSD